jgi:hypothetical protein
MCAGPIRPRMFLMRNFIQLLPRLSGTDVSLSDLANVRFGSKADLGGGSGNVRFTPKSGHHTK